MSDQYGYAEVPPGASARANRGWWDAEAATYVVEHGEFLGGAAGDFVWGPEGLREADARLLCEVAGADVLDLGCGGGQTTRWLAAAGARVVGLDLSLQMILAGAARVPTAARPPVTVADCLAIPFAAGSFDIVCSAYGAIPFVDDSASVFREVARVLRPGGRFVFSVTHPIRWAFPDEPDERGLTVNRSYFDTRPYRELDDDGALAYAEHHRTLGARIRELVAAGFTVLDLVEPPWPDDHHAEWGGWSPLRGKLIPGTAIFVSQRSQPE